MKIWILFSIGRVFFPGIAGVLITANHKEAVIFHCYTSHTGHTKVFQQWRKARKVYYFLGCYTDVTARCFRGKLKNSSRYHNSKNRRIRDRVDSRLQFVWKIGVMGSCTNRITCIIVPVSRRNHCSWVLDTFTKSWPLNVELNSLGTNRCFQDISYCVSFQTRCLKCLFRFPWSNMEQYFDVPYNLNLAHVLAKRITQ